MARHVFLACILLLFLVYPLFHVLSALLLDAILITLDYTPLSIYPDLYIPADFLDASWCPRPHYICTSPRNTATIHLLTLWPWNQGLVRILPAQRALVSLPRNARLTRGTTGRIPVSTEFRVDRKSSHGAVATSLLIELFHRSPTKSHRKPARTMLEKGVCTEKSRCELTVSFLFTNA